MKLLSRLSGLLGTGDEANMRYECTLCGTQTELAQAACPSCGGQMEQL